MPVTNQNARIVNVGPVWSGVGIPELHVVAFVHKGISVGKRIANSSMAAALEPPLLR